jgi:hypothetical protein
METVQKKKKKKKGKKGVGGESNYVSHLNWFLRGSFVHPQFWICLLNCQISNFMKQYPISITFHIHITKLVMKQGLEGQTRGQKTG